MDHCADLVRQYDRDRYLTALFSPAKHRDALMSLYAFDVEIKRVSDLVSDPMPGEIRLQWWSDAIANVEHGSIEGHPVAAALLATMKKYDLPAQPLLDLIEARRFDLYNDPMPSLTDLEGYSGETVSAVLQLAALVLSGTKDPKSADMSGHAGVALGLTAILLQLPKHSSKKQLYLPVDVLGRHGLSPQEFLLDEEYDRVAAVVREMCEHIRHHLDRFESANKQTGDNGLASAYLQIGILPLYLKAFESQSSDPRKTNPAIAQWRRQWALWKTARRLTR